MLSLYRKEKFRSPVAGRKLLSGLLPLSFFVYGRTDKMEVSRNELLILPVFSISTFFRFFQLTIDAACSLGAFVLAYWLRFEGHIPATFFREALVLLPWMLLIRLLFRLAWGVHQQLWRFVSLPDAAAIVWSITGGSVALFLLAHFGLHQHMPWGVLALDCGLNIGSYLGVRVLRRRQAEHESFGRKYEARHRLIIIGADEAGCTCARELMRAGSGVKVLGFVDDAPQKRGAELLGLKVLGMTADLPKLSLKLGVDEALLCLPNAQESEVRHILALCREVGLTVNTMPNLKDVLAGRLSVTRFRRVDIEDLLGRAPISFERESVVDYLAGRTVLVTGAGGSIGSELCRQIAELGPCRLLLLGRGEYSVYRIDQELKDRYPSLELIPLVADIRDERRMRWIFERFRPEVVFHAAANKHVPLMERNPSEAVLTNVRGTGVVALLAHELGTEAFVMVSTDKAVNPTNVMGATKRVAEQVVQSLAVSSSTRFMAVRFGNVLGSRGSVIPLFKRQIEAGGPVTVTHPDVVRYFMTIPEAAQLVLQAGAMGKGGEVFVLDMGAPVKVADLARDLISLSGFEPEKDIAIVYTGLRPGEKLYEELLTAEEGITSTRNRKIFVAQASGLEAESFDAGLSRLIAAAEMGDEREIRHLLRSLVETYRTPAVRVTGDLDPEVSLRQRLDGPGH